MRNLAVPSMILVTIMLAAPSGGAVDDPCRKWTCLYEFTGVEGEPPNVKCEEKANNLGQWVTCSVSRYCIWVVDENGSHRECTPSDCEGEYCMWV